MSRLRPMIVLSALALAAAPARAEGDGLIDENMLHPLDSFTAHTFAAGEFSYNQSPLTFPIPSWLWWGVTDWLSVEIDTLPLIGGIIEYGMPVPSINARVALLRRPGVALALENMVQVLHTPYRQLDLPHFGVTREGASWFGRLNLSLDLSSRVMLHLSAGATYSEWLRIENVERARLRGRTLRDSWNPDASVAIDWRAAEWISVHAAASYGTTFVYIDNVPRKVSFTYGVRVAPFFWSDYGVLRCFRAELPAFVYYFPDAGETLAMLLPLRPYVYWQWTF
jgi:hypothetical protein